MRVYYSNTAVLLWNNMKHPTNKHSTLDHSLLAITTCPIKQARYKAGTKSASFIRMANTDSRTKSALNFFGTSTSANILSKPSTKKSSSHFINSSPTLESNESDRLENHELWEKCKEHFVALDCEMVENIYRGSQLARCSVVDHDGDVLLDVYVQPQHAVADYHYKYSGIKPEHLNSSSAETFQSTQKKVLRIVKGKIVVGHSIFNDFNALKFFLPSKNVVDIHKLPALLKLMQDNGTKKSSLKMLSRVIMNKHIQKHTHCSVEDSQATMDLFKHAFGSWAKENSGIVTSILDNDTYLDDKYWEELNANDIDDL